MTSRPMICTVKHVVPACRASNRPSIAQWVVPLRPNIGGFTPCPRVRRYPSPRWCSSDRRPVRPLLNGRRYRFRDNGPNHIPLCDSIRGYTLLGLVYCDPEEAPVVWDYRAHRFLENTQHRREDIAIVFVCHWSQLREVDLVLHTFRHAYSLPIDRCCSIWLDSPRVQDLVEGFEGKVRVVDQPVAMTNIIRNRARYPHHNSCRC